MTVSLYDQNYPQLANPSNAYTNGVSKNHLILYCIPIFRLFSSHSSVQIASRIAATTVVLRFMSIDPSWGSMFVVFVRAHARKPDPLSVLVSCVTSDSPCGHRFS